MCLGNICRSPMAEGLMKKRLRELGLSEMIHVESRATSSYEIGRPPHPRTLAILNRENAPLPLKRAQRITPKDFETFDLIIGMDKKNVQDLSKMANHNRYKIHLYNQINQLTKDIDIADPYYTGRYEETFQAIDARMDEWIEYFKKTGNSY
ncbi:MAG: low molecular weight protein-tyrosine-phosphatase [Acholeplasmataceae bacterium]|nr:low molecular weight protein-tyrosine-phosphatase [Acholeplasmataceae bacterium]